MILFVPRKARRKGYGACGMIQNMDTEYEKGQVYTIAPTDERLPKEMAVYRLLDELGIAYQRVDHEAAMSIDDCKNVDQILQIEICKNLFLCNRQKTDFYLLMMPGKKPFKTKDLSAQIGTARLSFADEAHMEEFLDITPGSVSIMGLMNDTGNRVRLLIDEDVFREEYVGFHPCVNTSSIKARAKDIWEKFLPAVHHEYTLVKL